MEIAINKSSVVESVVMNVSVIARSLVDNNGESLYDKVRIQERDKGLVEAYVDAAYGSVLKELGGFIGSHTPEKLTLADNRRFDDAAISDLQDVVYSYMVSHASAEWMKMKAVEYATVFSGRAEAYLNTIFEKLRFKAEPVMKKYQETT